MSSSIMLLMFPLQCREPNKRDRQKNIYRLFLELSFAL